MRLSDQKIGTQIANQFSVNVIQGFTAVEPSPNLLVDFPARNSHIKSGFAAGRQSPHPIGVIALMRPPNKHFASVQGADDFGGAR
jgi:hypothetical protein